MHGKEELSGGHGRRDERPHAGRPAPRLDDHPAAGGQAEGLGVGRVDLDVRVARVELAKHVRLGRPRLGVPLRRTAAAGQELKRKPGIRRLRQRPRLLEEEPGAAVRVVEPAVVEEPPLRARVGVLRPGTATARRAPRRARGSRRCRVMSQGRPAESRLRI